MRAALLQRREGGLEATLLEAASAQQLEAAKRQKKHALHAWWQAGHPGWRVWEDAMDGDAFVRGVQQQARPLRVRTP
jgi:hypothetical protein